MDQAIQAAPPPATRATKRMMKRNIVTNPQEKARMNSEDDRHPAGLWKHDQCGEGYSDPVGNAGLVRLQLRDPGAVAQECRQADESKPQDCQGQRAAE